MYSQREIVDVMAEQLAPFTVGVDVGVAAVPASTPDAAPASSPDEIDGKTHAGAARSASTSAPKTNAAMAPRIMRSCSSRPDP